MDRQPATIVSRPLAQKVSLAIGVLSAILVITSIGLLIGVRDKKVISSAYATPTPTPDTTPKTITSQLRPKFELTYQCPSFCSGKLKLLVTATGFAAATTDIPTEIPGYSFYNSGVSNPLNTVPPVFGFVTSFADSQSVFASSQDGMIRMIQYDEGSAAGSFDLSPIYTGGGQSSQDSGYGIVIQKTLDNEQNPVPDEGASSVGCAGMRSLAMSEDGSRLYVGYSKGLYDAQDSTDPTSQGIHPYGQITGRVLTYELQKGQYLPNHKLIYDNPFGSGILNMKTVFNPVTGTETVTSGGVQITGDGAGEYLRATKLEVLNENLLAMRLNFAFSTSTGRRISILRENAISGSNQNVYRTDGTLAPPTYTAAQRTIGATIYTQDLINRSFATSFDIKNDVAIATIPPLFAFTWYKRNNSKSTWESQGTLFETQRGATEVYGTDCALHPDGDVCLIASPDYDGSTNGGQVILYKLVNNVWVSTQIIGVGGSVGLPSGYTHTGSWARFISVDTKWRIIGLGGVGVTNTSTLDPLSTTNETTLLNYIFDTATKLVVTDLTKAFTLQLPGTTPSDCPCTDISKPKGKMENLVSDPYFGCNVAYLMDELDDGSVSSIKVFVSSPYNQMMVYFRQTL